MKVVMLPGDRLTVEFEDEENAGLKRRVVVDFAKADERRLAVVVEDDGAVVALTSTEWAELCR